MYKIVIAIMYSGIVLKIKPKYVIFASKNTILFEIFSTMLKGADAIFGAISANIENNICRYITGEIIIVDNILKWLVVPKTYIESGAVINVAAIPVIRAVLITP